jgi:hypothetical protein
MITRKSVREPQTNSKGLTYGRRCNVGKENKKENIFICNPVLSFQYDKSRKKCRGGIREGQIKDSSHATVLERRLNFL